MQQALHLQLLCKVTDWKMTCCYLDHLQLFAPHAACDQIRSRLQIFLTENSCTGESLCSSTLSSPELSYTEHHSNAVFAETPDQDFLQLIYKCPKNNKLLLFVHEVSLMPQFSAQRKHKLLRIKVEQKKPHRTRGAGGRGTNWTGCRKLLDW